MAITPVDIVGARKTVNTIYPFLAPADNAVIIRVHVQPGRSKDEITGVHGDSLKIRLAAPPVEGRANERLIGFLSKVLGVKKAAIEIKQGPGSRRKLVRVEGTSPERIKAAVDCVLKK